MRQRRLPRQKFCTNSGPDAPRFFSQSESETCLKNRSWDGDGGHRLVALTSASSPWYGKGASMNPSDQRLGCEMAWSVFGDVSVESVGVWLEQRRATRPLTYLRTISSRTTTTISACLRFVRRSKKRHRDAHARAHPTVNTYVHYILCVSLFVRSPSLLTIILHAMRQRQLGVALSSLSAAY